MDHVTLQIVIKSADVFKNVNRFSKMRLYSTASLIISNSANISSRQIKTCIDEHSGTHPFWWFPVKFQVEKSKLFQNNHRLVFHVKCRQTLGGDKDIGRVSVNVLELYESARSHKYPNHVAFTLGGSQSGKPRGVLYMSYMFQQNQNETKHATETTVTGRGTPSAPPFPIPCAPYFPIGHGIPSAPPCPVPSAPYFPIGRGVPSAPPFPIPSAPFLSEDEYIPANGSPLKAATGGSAVLPSAPYLPENVHF